MAFAPVPRSKGGAGPWRPPWASLLLRGLTPCPPGTQSPLRALRRGAGPGCGPRPGPARLSTVTHGLATFGKANGLFWNVAFRDE